MGEKQQVFNAREITRFRMRCDQCQTDVVFNGEAEMGPGDRAACTNCGMPMAGVATVANAYRAFLRALKETKRGVDFVVTLKE